ncbi:MAG: ABC transporter substrate-binding protein [Treponema sp.]|jgi:iron complex transport system substrate-binding protein|nr:ABC transporter substrate-binding protein [Treponema sp.]
MGKTRRSRAVLLLFVLGAALFAGCKKSGASGSAGTPAPADPARIISTAPSNTEIIAGLGLGGRIIAADKYSLAIPELPPGTPEIDFFYPDPEVLVNLEPDIVIASEHNSFGAGEDPFRVLSEMGIRVLYIPTSQSIAAVRQDIMTIASALGAEDRGESLIREMDREIEAVAALGRSVTRKKRVYFEISPFPNPVTMGRETFLNEMLETAGALNVFADKTGWIAPSAEAVLERNPEVILTNVNFIDDPLGEIKSRQGFADTAAVQNGAVYLIDADSSSRPTHRLTLALGQISRALYPEHYGQ